MPQYPWLGLVLPDPHQVGEIIVINLARSTKRLSTFKQRNASVLPYFSVLEATDGRVATYRDVAGYLVNNKAKDDDIIGGNYACFTSHLRAWHQISLRDDDMVHIVIEDDVKLNADFFSNLEKLIEEVDATDADWDMIYLGNVQKKVASKEFGTFYSPSDVETKGINTGWLCNVLRPKGARKLMRHLKPATMHTMNRAGDHFIKRTFKYINLYMVFDTSRFVQHDWDVPSDRVEHQSF